MREKITINKNSCSSTLLWHASCNTHVYLSTLQFPAIVVMVLKVFNIWSCDTGHYLALTNILFHGGSCYLLLTSYPTFQRSYLLMYCKFELIVDFKKIIHLVLVKRFSSYIQVSYFWGRRQPVFQFFKTKLNIVLPYRDYEQCHQEVKRKRKMEGNHHVIPTTSIITL